MPYVKNQQVWICPNKMYSPPPAGHDASYGYNESLSYASLASVQYVSQTIAIVDNDDAIATTREGIGDWMLRHPPDSTPDPRRSNSRVGTALLDGHIRFFRDHQLRDQNPSTQTLYWWP